ncbi:regulatory protein RecX [Marinomonas ostreistagni]|uniref:regulatory protein RecX n=1 Tax=Marinomonas ostreistagni TaxID=359209 RepID=UPI001950272D|nr:regulatory protein RecX [Marinomonas ostreistagni]MBM6552111.1 regulatory protein RecX [Marinomonas ostreistagni]
MTQQDSFNYALWLLGAREHSVKEMTQKLTRKGFDAEQIAATITRLEEYNYLSDQRFAESFARSKASKPLGRQRIQNELRQKGISDEMARIALDQLEVDWFELALELKQRKFGENVEKDFKAKGKQTRYLVYRGFNFDEVRYAIEFDPLED